LPCFKKKNSLIKLNTQYIFVIDHNRKNFIFPFKDLIHKIYPEKVTVVSTNKNIINAFHNENSNIQTICVDNLINFNYRYFVKALIGIKEIKKIVDINVLEKFELFYYLYKISFYKYYYNKYLNTSIRSITTICDAHYHEHVISKIAHKKNINTITLQHAASPGPLWFPIASKYFLVWNRHALKVSVEKYKETKSIILIIGNPFSKDNEKINWKRVSTRKFTVTYIVTNWGAKESEILFNCFMKINSLTDIDIIIKLRPNTSKTMLLKYRNWIKKYSNKNIRVVYKDSVEEILKKSSVIVTYHSTVPEQAILLGIPSIILDIFDYIDLKNIINHYDDCLIAKNENDYLELIRKLKDDKIFYNETVNKLNKINDKYRIPYSYSQTIDNLLDIIRR